MVCWKHLPEATARALGAYFYSLEGVFSFLAPGSGSAFEIRGTQYGKATAAALALLKIRSPRLNLLKNWISADGVRLFSPIED